MGEAGHGPRFALEPGQLIGRGCHVLGQHLDRDIAPKSCIACAIDLTHAARAKPSDDPVGSELRFR